MKLIGCSRYFKGWNNDLSILQKQNKRILMNYYAEILNSELKIIYYVFKELYSERWLTI